MHIVVSVNCGLELVCIDGIRTTVELPKSDSPKAGKEDESSRNHVDHTETGEFISIKQIILHAITSHLISREIIESRRTCKSTSLCFLFT